MNDDDNKPKTDYKGACVGQEGKQIQEQDRNKGAGAGEEGGYDTVQQDFFVVTGASKGMADVRGTNGARSSEGDTAWFLCSEVSKMSEGM